MIITILD
jgi:hypothetical protein